MDENGKQGGADQSAWDRGDSVQRAAMLATVLPGSKMDKAKFEQLLAVAETDAQIKLRVLYNAVVSGVQEYGASSIAANLNNWKAAEKELDKYVEALWDKHFQGERVFKNIHAVCKYLTEEGWRVSPATVYNHQKQGKIIPNSSGKFTLSAVEKYIKEANLRKVDGSKPPEEGQSAKSHYEEEILRIKSEHMGHKLELLRGSFVPRDAFERALAQRARLFKSDIESFIRGLAPEMITRIGGDQAKAPDLIEFMLDEFQKVLARYAEAREWTPPEPPAAAAEETRKGDDNGEEDEEE